MSSNLKFRIEHINRYAVIDEPGTFKVRVRATVTKAMFITNRWLVPLRVLTSDGLETLKTAYTKDVLYKDISGVFMSGALWKSQVMDKVDLPVKGEELIATFDYVNGIIMCTGLTQIPRKKLPLFLSATFIADTLGEFEQLIKDDL